MIVLDTCVLIYDTLDPRKLTKIAKQTIDHSEQEEKLYCSDISLWEIAMLIQKRRLEIDIKTNVLLNAILQSRGIKVLMILPEIAALSATMVKHHDPADRIIAATALHHRAKLVTSDKKIHQIPDLQIVW